MDEEDTASPYETLTRESAILKISILGWSTLRDEDKVDLLFNAGIIDSDIYDDFNDRGILPQVLQDTTFPFPTTIDADLRSHYLARFQGIKSCYLERVLSDIFGKIFCVSGKVENLLPCHCCGFKVFTHKDYYQGWSICPACNWEDVGDKDRDQSDGCNGCTMNEYFQKFMINEDLYKVMDARYYKE